MRKLIITLCLAFGFCLLANANVVRANTRQDVQQLFYQLQDTYYAYQEAYDNDPTNEMLHGLETEYAVIQGRVSYILTLPISDGTLILDLAEINNQIWGSYLTQLSFAATSGYNAGAANADYAAHAVIEQVVYHNI